MLCSVLTENSNWQDGQEEDNMGWKRMKNLNIFGAHGKIWVLVGFHEKPIGGIA